MVSLLGIYFYYVLSLLFFLVGSKLILQKGLLASKFLGIQFLNLTLLILISYWTAEERFLLHPNLLKVSSPFVYLISPLAFLFQEFILFPDKKFKPIYLLHFLPFIFNIIELIPVYTCSIEMKLDLIKEILQQKSYLVEGKSNIYLIPPAYHQFIRLFQYFIYTSFILIRFITYIKSAPQKHLKKNLLLFSWLGSDLTLKIISLGFLFYFVFFPYQNGIVFHWQDLLKIVDYVIMSFFIFYHPNFLENAITKGIHTNKTNQITTEQYAHDSILFEQIENLFIENQYFLDESISPLIISEALNIPSRKVSQIIKTHTQLAFPDFINLMRFNYIEVQIKKNQEWGNFTFETIALESGFGSRSNFYNAFKKLKNGSPKDYYGNMKLQLEK